MEVVPREEAFLGGIKKAIKKVSKAVKNVAKSPIGKAAMLYFGGNLLQGNKLLGGNPFTGRITDFITQGSGGILDSLKLAKGKELTLSEKAMNALKVGGYTTALTGLIAAAEEGDDDAIEATTNVESLKKYLYSSYENLGYNPQEIPALVQRDVSEYTSGAGGYATGGRVKYQQGSGIGTLQGGSQTTPETGKASYAQGPQLYKDLIDYLQIEGPKPEMVNSEMMMNDMGGGAMPAAYTGSGSSGGTTGSSITSGSTGGGSGTGILQATPGTTQPTTTSPSNISQPTTQAPTVSTSTFTAPGKNLATTLRAYEEDPTSNIQKYYEYYTGEKDYRTDAGFQLAEERNKALTELGRKVRSGEFDPYKYQEEADRIKEYYAELNPLEYYGVRPDQMTYYDDRNNLINYRAEGGRIGYAKGTKMASADNPFFRSDYADEHSYRMFGKPYKELTASELEEFREEMERLRNKFMADGGRVNYAEGTKENLIIPKKPKFQTEEEVNATTLGRAEIDDPMPGRLESAKRLKGVMQLYDRLKKMAQSGEMSNKEEAMALFNKRMREESENLHFLDKEKLQDYIRKNRAYGGRMEYAMGSPEDNARKAAGIMDLPLNENKAGVTELDLRETGGFIPPVGVKEKADDIPAMLSNNEFVFTADAVRGMGNGDVNLGAQRMYDMMKKLENGGRV